MYKLITAPTSEPIITSDAKTHLRITHTDQDDYIDSLVKLARFQFESDCPSIQILPATWCLYLDEWMDEVMIKKNPLISVSSVKYYAEDSDTLSTLSSANYETDLISYPGRVNFSISTSSLPNLNTNKYNAVQITFTCGYADAASVPSDIIGGLKLLIGHFYENPQQVMSGTQINELPFGYKQIINNYIKNWV